MSALRLRSIHLLRIRRFSSLPEYTEKPQYPPIFDMSRDAVKKREREVWYDKIKCLESVEEKLMEVNMPRYYGWPCVSLHEGNVPYNSLHFAQYITRTFIFDQPEIPEYYQSSGLVDVCTPILEHIANPIKEAIALEYSVQREPKMEDGEDINDIGESIIHQINRVLMSSLSADFPHLSICQFDPFPRVESFWIVGGFPPSKQLESLRKKITKVDEGKPVDMNFQYLGRPVVNLRHEFPLLPVVDDLIIKEVNDKIPVFQYDPRVLVTDRLTRQGTNIPGFWPGDVSEFPLMSFHSSKYLAKRNQSFDDSNEAPHVHAILSSFAWLHAVACFQGFSPFQDVTYPLVTQTILSDGQYWSFYVYQLNTMTLHSDYSTENLKCNLCWKTPKLKLFDRIENGQVVGFNKDVLRILLYFYLNAPQRRSGVEMKPYLGAENKYVRDIADDKRRVWLEKAFKHMYCNRPRHKLPYEIYHWEKIYKIDHDTRPLEARRRPFELFKRPDLKRYDDHAPQYVPKAKREKKREKFEKTYYP